MLAKVEQQKYAPIQEAAEESKKTKPNYQFILGCVAAVTAAAIAAAEALFIAFLLAKAAPLAGIAIASKTSLMAATAFAAKAAFLASPAGIVGLVVGAILLVGLACLLPFSFSRNPGLGIYTPQPVGIYSGYGTGCTGYSKGVGSSIFNAPVMGGTTHVRGSSAVGSSGTSHTRNFGNTYSHSVFGGASRAPVEVQNPHAPTVNHGPVHRR
jgi:hypothetical protein